MHLSGSSTLPRSGCARARPRGTAFTTKLAPFCVNGWLRLPIFAAIWAFGSSMAIDASAATPMTWGFANVDAMAERLAASPFVPSAALPPELQTLDYDTYRLIAFEHAQAIWKGHTPFWLECFHRGYLFRDKVAINLVESGQPTPLAFSPALFQYRGALSNLQPPADSGFAGFRALGRGVGRGAQGEPRRA